MAKQTIAFGAPPLGIGGDTYKSAFEKCNLNFSELYLSIQSARTHANIRRYKDLLGDYQPTDSKVGALVLHLPVKAANCATMGTFKIRGYNYTNAHGGWELIVSGYNYVNASWHSYNSVMIGQAPFSQVRLAHAADHQVIIMGTPSTVWSYPSTELVEMVATYQGLDLWDTGYSFAYETDLSKYSGVVEANIVGSMAADKLTTARNINGIPFNGSSNINVPNLTIDYGSNSLNDIRQSCNFRTFINGAGYVGTHIQNPNVPSYSLQLMQTPDFNRSGMRVRINAGGTWRQWEELALERQTFKADGYIRDVSAAATVNTGPEFNEKSGMYRLNHGGASDAIAHFNCNGSSASSFQLRAAYGNGAIWYRSSRDNAGFENGWSQIITSGGGTIDGNLYVAKPITITSDDANGAFKKMIQGSTSTDGGYLAFGNTGADKGYVEIGTTDDHDTSIVARKRALIDNGVFAEAYILDKDNNTRFPGRVTSAGLYLNKQANVGTAISWYAPDYNAWQDYMAQAGSTTNGLNHNITAPSGALVNSWARRSVIENMGGYGWTFESMAAKGTTPNILMELSASTGELRVTGAFHGNNGVHTTKFHSHVPYSFYTTSNGAQRIHCGGLLASDAYADAPHVPNNGIYSKGDILVGTGVIGAPTSKFHNIDIGGDGKDRMIFSSYGGNFRFMNTASNVAHATINSAGITAPNFHGHATSAGKVIATRINGGSDLNNYTTEGVYYCDADAESSTTANTPINLSYSLRVERSAGVNQTFTAYNGGNNRVFVRGYYGGWSAWKELSFKNDLPPGMPIGSASWGPYNRNNLPPGFYPADGQWVYKSDFPNLWAAVNAGHLVSVNNDTWVGDINARASFGTHPTDGALFRLPDLNGHQGGHTSPVLRGDAYAASGRMVGDAIRNITGGVTRATFDTSAGAGSGAFSADNSGHNYGGGSGSGYQKVNINFDASRQVPTSDENRPKSAFGIYVIAIR